MTTIVVATVDDFPPDVIEAWRSDGTLDRLIEAGAILPPEPVVRSMANPYHDRRGRFAPKPGGATVVGITPNRGKTRDTLEEIQPYFSSSRYKNFQGHVQGDAPEHNLKVVHSERAGGFWLGKLEPSAAVGVRGGTAEAKAYAIGLAKRYRQDGVVAFQPRKGGGQRLYRWKVTDEAAAVQALRGAGVMGATVHGGRVEVIDLFGSEGAKMGGLGTLLGHRGQVVRGDGWLWEAGKDYSDSAIMTTMVIDMRGVDG